jgi:Fe2+ or Zn2+ uptake regulation protein
VCRDSPMPANEDPHAAVEKCLAGHKQRYRRVRSSLFEALAAPNRPLTTPGIVRALPELAQSSIYRNLGVLIDAGIVRRVAGLSDHSLYELSETFIDHHHHLVCAQCGRVEDLSAPEEVESMLADAARVIAARSGYLIVEHRLDFTGRCSACIGELRESSERH